MERSIRHLQIHLIYVQIHTAKNQQQQQHEVDHVPLVVLLRPFCGWSLECLSVN